VTIPIILCMIVRDEADTIGAVIRSALPHIEGIAILDTGSTDGTLDAIQRELTLLRDCAIVQSIEWPGRFDVARSSAWELADVMASKLGATDHLRLELSGDSYLSGELNREALQNPELDGAWVTSHMGPITWKRPKLTRSGRGWKYKGRLHETVVMEGRSPRLVDSGLHIEHRGKVRQQGGRDQYVAMMLADLEEHPDDPRTVFYAAQTLDTAGRWGEARALYEKRIRIVSVPQWDQERYIAALRVARRAVADGWDGDTVAALAERAMDICPSRPEAWELLGRRAIADGLRLTPKDDWLFYEP
jgi:hypothetical protein